MKSATSLLLAAALMAAPSPAQTPGFSNVVEFTGTTGARLGSEPASALVEHTDGNLYGVTLSGGTGEISPGSGYGTVFRLTTTGTFTSLVSFTGATGGARGFYPYGTLCVNTDGLLYGTCSGLPYGNANAGITFGGYGSAYKVSTAGVFTLFNVFSGTTQPDRGRKPIAGLTKVGNDFYGSTDTGGATTNLGTVFRMTSAGIRTYLLDFSGSGVANRGANPSARLLDGGDGYLYGSTLAGGTNGNGTLFRIRITTGILDNLVEFTGQASPRPGKAPADALLLASDGNLYGTTANGGALNAGTVFRYHIGSATLTTLVEFTDTTGNAQGAGPFGGLVEGPDGYLYGVTQYGGPQPGDHGTLFRISLATGQLTPRLVDFTGTSGVHKGSQPYGGLMKTNEGIIYGTTLYGGAGNFGTIWKLNTALLPQAPAVTTGATTLVTSSGATLNGVVNPRNLATAWQFEYGTTTAYGSFAPVTPGALAAGITDQPVNVTLAGLAADTLYHFRLRAVSTAGTTLGLDGTFTTGAGSPQAPIVVTSAATAVGTDTATLNGTINPRGHVSAWQFEYGLTTGYGNLMPILPGATGGGIIAEAVTTTLTGLPGGTAIHYRLKATSIGGTAYGDDLTFTTTGPPQAPVVGTGTATEITGTTAVLNGTVNPRGTLTTWQFHYGPDESVSAGVVPLSPASIGNGITAVDVNVPLTGLTPGATVHFKLSATSAAGTTNGSIRSFTTAIPPDAVTQAAVAVTTTGATLKGSVDPNGSATTYQFDYGPDTNYGSVVPAEPGTVGSGNSPETVAENLTGLAPGTTIHYRLRATNSAGTSLGSDFSFTTKQPPTVTTGLVQNLSASGATLTGTIIPHGSASTWQFDYGLTSAYGSTAPFTAGTTGSGNSPENVSSVLSALLPNTTYHFRLRAENANGTTFGPDFSFTTKNNLSGWRQQHFGTTANTGNAANTADPDGDGVINLLEYAYGMNPNAPDRHLLPVPSYNGSTMVASFTSPASVDDILYGAESSTNLINWSPLADGGAGRLHTFVSPVSSTGENHMRLRVTVIP